MERWIWWVLALQAAGGGRRNPRERVGQAAGLKEGPEARWCDDGDALAVPMASLEVEEKVGSFAGAVDDVCGQGVHVCAS